MNKYAIITRADSGVQDWIDTTHPIMEEYAKKCGADFIMLDHVPENGEHLFWRILKTKELFNKYERVLHLDTDILINKDCPNLFEIVPEDTIGCVLEDKGSRRAERLTRLPQIQNKFGNVAWESGYMNEAVLMMSRIHSPMLDKIDGQLWDGPRAPCATHFGWQIAKNGFKVMDLGYKWNHMSMFSEGWNGSPSRFDSYMIHYAGGGRFNDKGNLSALELCKKDKNKIYG